MMISRGGRSISRSDGSFSRDHIVFSRGVARISRGPHVFRTVVATPFGSPTSSRIQSNALSSM